MDIGETNHPENRIAQDDPRTDQTAQNKLLLFHNTLDGNDQGDPITIDLFKQDNNSVFWAQISRPNSLTKENFWKFKLALPKITTRTLRISNTTEADYEVKFGMDFDRSESLEGEEVFGTYQIYGISRANYNDARTRLNSLTKMFVRDMDFPNYPPIEISLLEDLEAAITYRLANGKFPGKGFATRKDKDFTPTDYSQSTTLVGREYDKVTHKCGGRFFPATPLTDGPELTERVKGRKINGQPAKAVPERLYPESTLTIPIYQYDSYSDAVNTLVNAEEFRKKLNAILVERQDNKALILKTLEGLVPGSTTTITLPLAPIEEVSQSNPPGALAYVPSYNAGFVNGVGLGRAELSFSPTLEMTAILEDGIVSDSLYLTEVVISGEVEDVLDYNYFTEGYTVNLFGATILASSVQCGFNRPEAEYHAGQVAKVIVSFENKEIVFNPPILLKSE